MIDDTRTVGDIHHDRMIYERNQLKREVCTLKERISLLEAENNTLKTMIENARIVHKEGKTTSIPNDSDYEPIEPMSDAEYNGM